MWPMRTYFFIPFSLHINVSGCLCTVPTHMHHKSMSLDCYDWMGNYFQNILQYLARINLSLYPLVQIYHLTVHQLVAARVKQMIEYNIQLGHQIQGVVLLEKVMVTQLARKFPVLNGNWRFITMFTTATKSKATLCTILLHTGFTQISNYT